MAARGIFTRSTPADVDELVPQLRPADREECLALTGKDPRTVLLLGLLLGRAVTFRDHDGTMGGIFGVSPGEAPHIGHVWLLGTPLIERRSVAFLRESQVWLDRLHRIYPTLVNVMDARNVVHRRWLEWLGFIFIRRVEAFGPAGIPIIEFARIAHVQPSRASGR